MRKTLWMFVVLFLLIGMVAFTQEGGGNSSNSVDQYPWYYKMEVAAGFQMGFAMTGAENWAMRPTIAFGFRQYVKPVFRSLILGYSIFGTLSFPSEVDWKSPDGQFVTLSRDNLSSLWGFGGLFGPSLQGRMFGPVGLVLDAGAIANFEGGRGDYSWSSQYQGYNISYNIIDLGLGLNAGMFIDFGRFFLEGGANVGYSLFRFDIYELYDSGSSSNIIDSDRNSGTASIIRAAPYILIGFKF